MVLIEVLVYLYHTGFAVFVLYKMFFDLCNSDSIKVKAKKGIVLAMRLFMTSKLA